MVFGGGRNSRVAGAQKAEIVAIMAPDVPAWRPAAVMAALILGPILWVCAATAFVWAVSGHDEPTGGDVIAVLLLGLVLLPAALYFCPGGGRAAAAREARTDPRAAGAERRGIDHRRRPRGAAWPVRHPFAPC